MAPEDRLDVHGLIEAQRMLAQSKHPFAQIVCVLWINGSLKRRLARLTDRQIAQLMFDYVWDDLIVFSPAAAICEHATERLFRSERGSWTQQDKSVMDEDTPPCPACGAETVRHVGINEPDFVRCGRAECGHTGPLGQRRRRQHQGG
jgi:hypothetical protein